MEIGGMIMMTIQPVGMDAYETVKQFYDSLIDAMADAKYQPGWKKGIYPPDAFLRESIQNGELIIGTLDGEIAASMIVNHAFNESYLKAEWPTKAEPAEITVIHALGVHPRFARRGFAKALVSFAIDTAKQQHQKVIWLDTLADNLPAQQLYLTMGFRYVDTVFMYYEDTGWTHFQLFEYPL